MRSLLIIIPGSLSLEVEASLDLFPRLSSIVKAESVFVRPTFVSLHFAVLSGMGLRLHHLKTLSCSSNRGRISAMSLVSSADIIHVFDRFKGRSLIKMANNMGPRTEP